MILKRAWNRYFENDDDLLFGTRKTAVNLCTLHPDTVQIFQLWQIYLDNVNPLLKVTHIPSLQTRIVEAAGSISNMRPAFEALMFSIYCISILSLDPEDCLVMFGCSQADLLAKYQFGCQQALLNCGFLRCYERDCLTALYLYLVSLFLNLFSCSENYPYFSQTQYRPSSLVFNAWRCHTYRSTNGHPRREVLSKMYCTGG